MSTPRVHFDHVAIATQDNALVRDLLLDLFGGTIVEGDWRDNDDAPTFRGVQIDIGGTMIELVQPASPASFLQPFLAKRGPGLHHITWQVDGLDGLVAALERRGVPLTGVLHQHGRIVNAFIRPSASYGVLTQLRPAEGAARACPALPGSRPARGQITAVTIAVPDAAAVAFFQSILGGETGDRPAPRRHRQPNTHHRRHLP